jgi:hypothetical protein
MCALHAVTVLQYCFDRNQTRENADYMVIKSIKYIFYDKIFSKNNRKNINIQLM